MDKRLELATRVASLYYDDRLTQAEIAEKIGRSRATVSRLLQEAREEGIVDVIVHQPYKRSLDLEEALQAHFPHLRHVEVLVRQQQPYAEMLKGIGVLAARYLEKILTAETLLGISWGTAVHSMVTALKPKRKFPITVVQMIGAASTHNPQIDGPDLARRLAELYEGDYYYFHAPLIVEAAYVKDSLLQSPSVKQTLALATQVDVAVVGLGSLDPDYSSLLRAGYITPETLDTLRATGAVGDICGHHFDIHGQPIDTPLNQRIIGVDLSTLQQIEDVIGIAGGSPKAEVILGALRGQYINTLFTDDAAARRILTLTTQSQTKADFPAQEGSLHRFVGDEHRFDWERVPLKAVDNDAAPGVSGKVLIGPMDSAPNFRLRYFRIEPGGHSSLERHPHDHGVFILHGHARVQLGNRTLEAGPRDVIYIPGNVLHQFQPLGDVPLGFLCIIPPKT
ncbi:MAG: sugar-binding domain-containing protein [Anaerolineae bacterium]